MRLIDADKIIYTWTVDADGEEHDGVTLQSIIHKMPTIDAVEVVRCKDCIHSSVLLDEYDNECGYACNKTYDYDAGGFWLEVEKDHFCGYGERGEADD